MRIRNLHIISLAMFVMMLIFPTFIVSGVNLFVINKYIVTLLLEIIGVLLSISALILGIIDKKHCTLTFLFLLISLVSFVVIPEVMHNVYSLSRDEIKITNSCITIIGLIAVNLIASFINVMDMNSLGIKDIVEIAIFVAAAIVLDMPFFKIKIGQNGGSISFVMIPLAILCLRKGLFKGLISCGLIFGVLDCLIDPYGFVTFPFDYFLAFGSLSLFGLLAKSIFNNKKQGIIRIELIIISLIVLVIRTLAHTLSGVIYYQPITFVESLAYNSLYVLPSGALLIVGLQILYSPLAHISKKAN
ncbi:MAG: energy-coupled thiamine transporter ThiT [bacterium]|nr:energy-coupled thiamine transporter ThiT [bacterium]